LDAAVIAVSEADKNPVPISNKRIKTASINVIMVYKNPEN
jgi:hypothetical protein